MHVGNFIVFILLVDKSLFLPSDSILKREIIVKC
jgi:hypothetical protein